MAVRGVCAPAPLYGIVLSLFHTLCFGHGFTGPLSSIVVLSLLAGCFLTRLLSLTKVVIDPHFTGFLMAALSLRWALVRDLPLSDSLGMILLCFSFIFFTTDQFIAFGICICRTAMTRLEYVLLYATFAVLFLLRGSILRCLATIAGGSVHVLCLVGVTRSFKRLLQFLTIPTVYVAGALSLNPFRWFEPNAQSIETLRSIHALIDVSGPPFIAACFLMFKSAPLGFFWFSWILAIACIGSKFVVRLILPVQALTIVVGFDSVLSPRRTGYSYMGSSSSIS